MEWTISANGEYSPAREIRAEGNIHWGDVLEYTEEGNLRPAESKLESLAVMNIPDGSLIELDSFGRARLAQTQ